MKIQRHTVAFQNKFDHDYASFEDSHDKALNSVFKEDVDDYIIEPCTTTGTANNGKTTAAVLVEFNPHHTQHDDECNRPMDVVSIISSNLNVVKEFIPTPWCSKLLCIFHQGVMTVNITYSLLLLTNF